MPSRKKAKKPAVSLLEVARTASGYTPRTWLDTLSPEQRTDVIEVATGMANGTFPASLQAVSDAWQQVGINCSKGKLQALVSKIRSGVKV